ncbi:MAG: hypothetical protein WAQ52_01535 [Terriglobales bacterium]
MNSSREVQLPSELCQAAEQLIKGTKFATLEEFLTFVLQEVTSNRSAQAEEQERKVIEDRLRDLGYL